MLAHDTCTVASPKSSAMPAVESSPRVRLRCRALLGRTGCAVMIRLTAFPHRPSVLVFIPGVPDCRNHAGDRTYLDYPIGRNEIANLFSRLKIGRRLETMLRHQAARQPIPQVVCPQKRPLRRHLHILGMCGRGPFGGTRHQFSSCTSSPRWTLLLHAQFARIGAFYRYEAYLVMLGLLAAVLNAKELLRLKGDSFRKWLAPPHRTAMLLIGSLCIAYPLMSRAWCSLKETPTAMANIYQQQYQMGLFLRTYYDGQAVAANDIGAVCFLADIRLLDLAGLATTDVVRNKIAGI
jgi:hypothetical protein